MPASKHEEDNSSSSSSAITPTGTKLFGIDGRHRGMSQSNGFLANKPASFGEQLVHILVSVFQSGSSLGGKRLVAAVCFCGLKFCIYIGKQNKTTGR